MIELPESQNLANQVNKYLLGKSLKKIEANKSPHKFAWFSGDPKTYHKKLTGKKFTGANAFGGMVEIKIDNMSLVFNDGTNVRFFEKNEKLPLKHQLHIEFDDSSSLIFSVQMYGGIWLVENNDWENSYYISSRTKISPVSKENTKKYFVELMNQVKQNYSVKAFLATEQRYPGLGNGVLQDILFNAKVNPRRKLETLELQEKEAIYLSVRQTLKEMINGGGRDTEKDIFGAQGNYRTILSAKTKGQPCPACGSNIVREAYLGGNIYFCPVCQPV